MTHLGYGDRHDAIYSITEIDRDFLMLAVLSRLNTDLAKNDEIIYRHILEELDAFERRREHTISSHNTPHQHIPRPTVASETKVRETKVRSHASGTGS